MTECGAAIVTGAGGAIGGAVCRRLADEGFQVAALDADVAAAQSTVAALRSPALALDCDVTSPEEVAAAVGRVVDRFGKIEVLVNNAGILGPPSTRLVELDRADWDRVLAVNLTGAWQVSRAVIPLLEANGGGCVVNISSGAAFNGVPGLGVYGASKAALLHLTKTLALEHARKGVRCVAVCPGNVETPMLAEIAAAMSLAGDPNATATLTAYHALPRLATVEDIAGVVAFLVSGDADFLTGSAILVDGGALAGRSG